MQHSHFVISTIFLAKEQSAKAKLKDGTHLAFLQWTSFDIPLDETPGETQTFFLLTFLKRCNDSSPVTRELSLLVSLQQIGENSDTFSFVEVGEFVGDPSSQFPYFSEFFETTNDTRWSNDAH